MIKAVIYDKVANTQLGQMGGEVRVTGHRYIFPGFEPGKGAEMKSGAELLTIVEEKRGDQKVVVLSYDNDMQQVIPDRGIEKILKFQ